MPIPIKKSDPPRITGRRRATTSVPSTPVHPATPPVIVPQLVPLLDLLADLIAQSIWRQRGVSDECVDREAPQADAVASVHGSATVVLEQPGKTGPFPNFPADSKPKCHQNPNNHPHADTPVRKKEHTS